MCCQESRNCFVTLQSLELLTELQGAEVDCSVPVSVYCYRLGVRELRVIPVPDSEIVLRFKVVLCE